VRARLGPVHVRGTLHAPCLPVSCHVKTSHLF
jgi:hypothetical protein